MKRGKLRSQGNTWRTAVKENERGKKLMVLISMYLSVCDSLLPPSPLPPPFLSPSLPLPLSLPPPLLSLSLLTFETAGSVLSFC